MLLANQGVYANIDVGVTAHRPSAAPSGALVVFSADFDHTEGLWIASIDGKSIKKINMALTSDYISEPAWSPDGQQIAFVARDTNGVHDIWVVRPDGTGLKQITSKGLNNIQPSWSPNSAQIVFTSNRGGSNDVWVMAADGSNSRRVTTLPGQENHPSFSPDGTMIAFSYVINRASTLMRINLDGSNLRSLTTGVERDRAPNWSRYGIVFSSNRSSDHWRIWKVQADGSGLGLVNDVMALDPTWLPDGRIVFGDEMTAPNGALNVITVLDPATGQKSLVSTILGYLTPIDIRPTKEVNKINLSSKGKVSVAILSTKEFNATTMVDQSTLRFGKTGTEASLSHCGKKPKDVNKDGLLDLVCSFRIKDAAFSSADRVGILRFATPYYEVPYEGRDSVLPVMDNDKDNEDPDE